MQILIDILIGTLTTNLTIIIANNETAAILKAMEELSNRTCIRFRPFRVEDQHWVQFKGDDTGCWALVGMRDFGQVINLQRPSCIHHGTIVHEMLHTIGFYHQQSATNRDEYVNIIWKNIDPSMRNNFQKFDHSIVTDFNVTYDYDSVLHYGSKAFSINGENTIEPLVRIFAIFHYKLFLLPLLISFQDERIKLGQRDHMSERDALKVNIMYEKICERKNSEPDLLAIIFNCIRKSIGFH